MKGYAYLVNVNWALLFWFGMLLMDLITSIILTISNRKVKKELLRQNQLIIEQNDKINTVIIRVCSKSVCDRKEQQTEKTGNEVKA